MPLKLSGQKANIARRPRWAQAVTTLAVTAMTVAGLTITTSDRSPVMIDWGNGVTSPAFAGIITNYTYPSAFTGNIKIYTTERTAQIIQIVASSGTTGFSFNLSALPSAIQTLIVNGANTISGNLSSIPNANTINVQGSNTISGNVSSIPNVVSLTLTGSNTVTGSLSSIPNVTILQMFGSNTLSGNLSSIPNVTILNVQGSNTISGNLSSIPLATSISITGSNTVSGNLSAVNPAITLFNVQGSNTITGDIAALANATSAICIGSNTLSGNIASLTNTTTISLQGANTITFSGTWPRSSMIQVTLRPASSLSTTVTDAMLNSLAAVVTTWTSTKVANIKGSRTSASDAAVTTLQGRGVTVTIG